MLEPIYIGQTQQTVSQLKKKRLKHREHRGKGLNNVGTGRDLSDIKKKKTSPEGRSLEIAENAEK